MANPFSLPSIGADNPLAPEYLALERQKKIADLLMQKGQQLPEGQMVSGHYVAPSLTQQLNPLLNAYMGGNMAEQNEARTAKLADLLRGQNVTEAQDILSSLKGSADYKLATMPQIQRDDMGNLMPQISQTGSAPNPQEALLKAINARGSFGQALAPQLVSNMFKEETPLILAENATAFNRKGDVIATGKAKEEKPPVSYQEYLLAKNDPVDPFKGSYNQYQDMEANRKAPKINVGVGSGEVSGGGVNNNGVPVGKFDKMGRYISPKGEVYPASAVTEARKEHDAATDLAFKLNQLSESDIKNAYGSLTDYTTSRVGRMAGSTKTVDAQTKINNLQINSVLNNLSQLKGASSDKEMAQMIKDFPGYEASPKIMENWVERASTATNRFLKRSENRFGFDTEYANPSIKSTTKDDTGDFTIRRKQ